jgi:1-acyl-sn-glycerol-3-phosphate acyltransferase
VSLYNIGKYSVWVICKTFYRMESIGVENLSSIPENQGVLLCANHVSQMDPPAIGSVSPRELSFMAKAELFDVPFLGKLISKVNAFPIKRGASDRASIKMALHILNEGKTLIMFPEGTRSKSGEMGEAKAGAGFLALKTDALIIPVAVIGHYKIFRKTKIVFGKPIDLTSIKENKGRPIEASEIIMKHIKELYDKYNN